jgi:phenylacetate-CoA ligase
MNLGAIYAAAPLFLRQIAVNVEGWRIQRSRYGPGFLKALGEAEFRARWSDQEVQAFRDARLRKFVRHAACTVPYYRRLFRELGLKAGAVRTMADMSQLPVLTKADVQQHPGEMVSESAPSRRRRTIHTSGTTGAGLHIATTREALWELWAVWWRSRRWHGIQPGTWCGFFGGRSVVPTRVTHPPFWVHNHPGRQVRFSAYHISDRTADFYIAELRRRRLQWLHGYPSVLALLAHYVLESGEDLGYQVRWVTTSSESLLPQQVSLMEAAFGARPIQDYGMAEAVACFSECELGALHVDEDFAATEFVQIPGEGAFRVIGTNFTNMATPLLRYDTTDVVTLRKGACPCGRSGRIVSSVDGRREDYIIRKDGSRIGRMDHAFKDMVRIREAQIHQTVPGRIEVRIVRGSGYGATDERALLAELRQRLGDATEVSVRYVDTIARSGAGKLRFVVSEIEDGRLAGGHHP